MLSELTNKTYKIDAFYNFLFNSCFSVTKRDNFTNSLMVLAFPNVDVSAIPNLNKSQLFEHMLSSFTSTTSYLENNKETLTSNILHHDRIVQLKQLYFSFIPSTGTKLVYFNIRLPSNSIEYILNFSYRMNTLKFVVELIISNFIVKTDPLLYDIILFSFKHHLEEQESE